MRRVVYFIPAIFFTIMYLFLFLVGAGTVEVWGIVSVVLFVISGILLLLGKYWGSIIGVLPAIYLIYSSFQNHGQIFNESIIGILLIIYYAILCYVVYQKVK